MTSTISVAIQAAIAWLEGQEREGGKTGVYMRERGKGERSKGERKEGRKEGERKDRRREKRRV